MTTIGQATPPTTLPPRPQPRPQPPRRLTAIRLPDVLSLVGALTAALCTTALLWTQIAPFSCLIG